MSSSSGDDPVDVREGREGWKDAGFEEVSVLPIEHDFLRFYHLDR
jgi:hypothetical protein